MSQDITTPSQEPILRVRHLSTSFRTDDGVVTAVDDVSFDVFAGEGIGAGKRSIAISVHIQPQDKTLTDHEIEAIAERIIANVAQATGGELR